MNGYSFTLATLFLATMALLIYAASWGSVTALVTLAVVLTIVLVAVGSIIALIATKIMADQKQREFSDNAQENLSIMLALQKIQNQQHAALMQQLNQATRLPQPVAPVDLSKSLLIEDGIFAELDN